VLTASISVTLGGVTTENRPHFSKKARLSARSLLSSRTSSVMKTPPTQRSTTLARVAATIKPRSLEAVLRPSARESCQDGDRRIGIREAKIEVVLLAMPSQQLFNVIVLKSWRDEHALREQPL
jgi:hypothetical protein